MLTSSLDFFASCCLSCRDTCAAVANGAQMAARAEAAHGEVLFSVRTVQLYSTRTVKLSPALCLGLLNIASSHQPAASDLLVLSLVLVLVLTMLQEHQFGTCTTRVLHCMGCKAQATVCSSLALCTGGIDRTVSRFQSRLHSQDRCSRDTFSPVRHYDVRWCIRESSPSIRSTITMVFECCCL